MRVRLAQGPGTFSEVATEWRTLLDEVQVTYHTQLEEWARAASVADGPSSGWFCAEDANGPLALLHCNVERRRLGPIGVTVLKNGPADGVLADRCDPAIVRDGLFQACARNGHPVDVLSLSGLRVGSAFHTLAQVTSSDLRQEQRFGGYSVVDTRTSADEWFSAAGKNLRGGLRKASNRADRQGGVRTVAARSRDDVQGAFDHYCQLEATGWKASAGALVNRPGERRYLEAGLLGAAAVGRARVRSLHIGGELAACQLGVVAGTTLVLLKVAYDEDLASVAPGNLLMASLVRECCDDPDIDHIDLVTKQDWHTRWHPTTHPTFQAQDFNVRRPTGFLARAAATLREARAR